MGYLIAKLSTSFRSRTRWRLALALCVIAAFACNAPLLEPSTPTSAPPTQAAATNTIPPPPTPEPTPTQPPEPAGKIAFTCQIFGEATLNQICLMNVDGSDGRRLTPVDTADHLYPSLSPDGQSVVFASNRTGVYEVYEQPLDGQARQLTNTGDAYAPAISPDSRQIVFTVSDGEEQALWLMNRDGSSPRVLIQDAWDAAWSPDGTRILHASDRAGEVQLYIVNLDGSGLMQVTNTSGLRGRSDWSANGALLSTYIGTSWNREIFVLDPDGSNLRAITSGGNNLAPSFSPDGEWLAFTSYMDRYRDEEGCEIYIMRVDGSDIRRLTNNEYCDWQPRWGP